MEKENSLLKNLDRKVFKALKRLKCEIFGKMGKRTFDLRIDGFSSLWPKLVSHSKKLFLYTLNGKKVSLLYFGYFIKVLMQVYSS